MRFAYFLAQRLFILLPQSRVVLMIFRKMWACKEHILSIARDVYGTRRAARYLREVAVEPDGRVLNLFALDDDSINTLKLLSLMSQALRLRGWTVQVVLRNRSVILGRIYFRAFGIRRFIYLDDQRLSEQERTHCRQHANALLGGQVSLQAVKAWTYQGCWIGPQIIATLSRIRFEGSIDFASPEVRARLAAMLAPALEYVLRAQKLMQRYPADLAVTNEANYAAFGPLVDLAISGGCNVIQMVQPWRDDALTFRRLTRTTRRDHPSSVSRETLDELARRPWTSVEQQALDQLFRDRYGGRWFLQERNQRSTRPYRKNELVSRFDLEPAKPIAVVFSHVLWDANLFYGNDLFEDYGEWFVETVRAACANPAVNWLIKLHPANVWKRNYENITKEYAEFVLISTHIGTLPPHVKIIAADDNISTLSLFEAIDYGITVRGTSGMELVCFGKQCVTAGTGRYSGLGFTLDSADREEYLHRLSRLHTMPAMGAQELHRAKWHAYAAFVLRPWEMVSATTHFNYPEKGSGPLDHNLQLTAVSLEQLQVNGDLRRWGDWAVTDRIDYVEWGETVANAVKLKSNAAGVHGHEGVRETP